MNTAFEYIWDEFSIPLKSYINRRVHNEQDAEDILQTVFLKLLSNLQNLKDIKKIYSWVYTITKNAIFDYYKSQKQELNIDDYEEDIHFEPQEESSVNKEIEQCIKIMIQHLPEKYKEAIILTEFQNISQKELAIRMGISVPGAKSRVQRARHYLKDMLLNCCNFEKDHRGNIIDYKRKNINCDFC